MSPRDFMETVVGWALAIWIICWMVTWVVRDLIECWRDGDE